MTLEWASGLRLGEDDDDTAALSLEHQLILSCCWLTLKVTGNTITCELLPFTLTVALNVIQCLLSS